MSVGWLLRAACLGLPSASLDDGDGEGEALRLLDDAIEKAGSSGLWEGEVVDESLQGLVVEEIAEHLSAAPLVASEEDSRGCAGAVGEEE